ncbi:phenazine biosynthesis protein PhzF [Shewanella algae]|uniref:PhzF family phenazine biosynthesis protein n=1 Tax=Shewanella algae TaxID=38313 RepID=UPI001181FF39|nr:PhzF family phenazine biosynthesis protein [Shewanella algae]TVK92529.1 phenazine biosynthesis protein PhzF [Shewanella algae]UZD58915.1 PhzF family phenazine biosynthesis protein [Shewanella algae]
MTKVYKLNSFSINGLGGNPAGVVIDSSVVNSTHKMLIAKNVGFSETAFVRKGKDADFDVEFYTPQSEVDFCGHATLAVFTCLLSLGLIDSGKYTQRTKAGILRVFVDKDTIVMEQALPFIRTGPKVSDVAKAIGVREEDISSTGLPIKVVSTGLPDVIVPISKGLLGKLKPDYTRISRLSCEFGTIGFHVFELSDEREYTAYCRNFAPLYGVDEESATGSASGALGCYLYKYLLPVEASFVFLQGEDMGSPSLIQVDLESSGGMIRKVLVGGKAVMFGSVDVSV